MRILITALALVCLLPLAAHAAIVDIHVTSPADSGPNTLRQAIIDGNALPNNGVPRILIDLDYSSPILLASSLPALNASYFEIRGTRSSSATIDGRGTKQILTTSSSVLLFKLKNVTLTNGWTNMQQAACLQMRSPASPGFANLEDVRFKNCRQSLYDEGVARGGAIGTAHNLTIKNSLFQNNSSVSNGTVTGGAIRVYGEKDLTISGSRFFYNYGESNGPNSRASGGAIYMPDGKSITIEDSDFAGNFVKTPYNNGVDAQFGGAVFARLTGKLSLLRTAFYGNDAGQAGAIWYEGVYPGNPTVELRNVSAINNRATRGNGGVLVSNNSQLTLYNNTFWRNSAAVAGDNLAAGVGTVLIAAAYNNLFAAGVGAGDSCSGFVTASSGYNIVPALECGFGSGATDRITNDLHIRGVDLGYGMNYTVQLYSRSPAYDAGNPLAPSDTITGRCMTTDLLRQPRPVDASGTGTTPRCDIGAFEAQSEPSLFIDDFEDRWMRP